MSKISIREDFCETLSEKDFKKRVRLTKLMFEDLLWHIEDTIASDSNSERNVSPKTQLLCTLHYLAHGSLLTAGDFAGISDFSVRKSVQKVTAAIVGLSDRLIYFPPKLSEVAKKFEEKPKKGGLPNTIGAIDCTRVPIVAQANHDMSAFIDRTGKPSMCVQLICGPDNTVYDVAENYPGGIEDMKAYLNSSVYKRLEIEHEFGPYHLVGDSGYALSPFCMVPINHHDQQLTAEQKRYNSVHYKTRFPAIESVNGIIKERFHCLHHLELHEFATIQLVIRACVVLHNFMVRFNAADEAGQLFKEIPHLPLDEPTTKRKLTFDEKLNLILNVGMRGDLCRQYIVERLSAGQR